MGKSFGIGLVFGGFLLLGCGDEASGPAVGPDLRWQFDCPKGSSSECKNSSSLHAQSDELNIKASCKRTAAGLQITLEDPGAPAEDDKAARSRSVLEIKNAVLDDERCAVTLTEYVPGSDTNKLRLQDRCMGNMVPQDGKPGTCELLEGDSGGGYDFDGTLYCEGMAINGLGEQDYRLSSGPAADHEPISLQIRNCN